MWWISVILMIIAGILNATMDVLKTRFKTSIFRFWKNQQWINPSLSWHNKWKPKTKFGDLIMSTVLVWVTDMWHLAKMLMLMCIAFAISFYDPAISWWLDVLIMYFSFTVPFEIFYSKVLIKT